MEKGVLLIACFFILSVDQLILFASMFDNESKPIFRRVRRTRKWKQAKWKMTRKWRFSSTTFQISPRKSSTFSVRKVLFFVRQLCKSFVSEPIAAKTSNETIDDNDNTYFVSFLLRSKKNKTMKNTDGQPRQRMVVNNNFSGDKMGTSQVFVESGPPPKQPPMHNIQLLNNAINPSQGYQQPQPQSPQHQPQPYQQPYNHKQQQPVGLKYG